ncbi:hypothetical protein F0Q45_08595 [Mycobacterium simiae]|uniref:Uncharacterized protein n=1 Tax=Mycobacterium simiae TaxID=1784 RepID=A0A5B1BT50_MYCSI|nr:hypothetical protein [Mycobacterium simiae]KAA1250630.1 hypothetical protein F0Q45_08595 [Mycobacterium simiae]
MQIQPLTLLCVTACLAGRDASDTGFEELRELCAVAGDEFSLAIGMSGSIMALVVNGRGRDAARLACELIGLIESIGDPTLTVGLFYAGSYAKWRPVRSGRLGDWRSGPSIWPGEIRRIGSPLAMATGLKGTEADLREARVVIDRLASVPTDPGFVPNSAASRFGRTGAG